MEGYSKFKYSLGMDDMLVEFESVNDVSMSKVDSVTKLSYKFQGKENTFTADLKAEIASDVKFTAILSSKGDSFLVKYSHKNVYAPNFEFQLQVVPSTKGLWIPGKPYDIFVESRYVKENPKIPNY